MWVPTQISCVSSHVQWGREQPLGDPRFASRPLGFSAAASLPILPCPSWCHTQAQGFFTGTGLNASFRRFSYLLSQAAGGDEHTITPAELFSYPVTLSAEKVPLISRWKLLLLLHPCQKGLIASCQQTDNFSVSMCLYRDVRSSHYLLSVMINIFSSLNLTA